MPRAATSRLQPDQRRRLIVDAARRVILAKGLAGVGMRDVAAAADVSLGTVTHHFASLDEILEGVLRAETMRFGRRQIAALARRRSALEGLQAMADDLFSDTRDMREYWTLWLDYWARAAHDRGLADWSAERYRIQAGIVADLLAEGVAAGELREVDPTQFATELSAIMDGLGVQAYFPWSELTPHAANERIEAFLRERLLPPEA
jgi:AcrR family transcriptional regulator